MIELKNIRPGEKIIRVIKVHWITYLVLGIQIFITLFLSFLFLYILGLTAISLSIIVGLWIISLIMVYVEWINYELDMFIITNSRIIGIEQIGFLNRTVSETNLSQVQEVNSKTKGFFSNIFNYGDISIQTAGNKTTITMSFCPDSIEEASRILNIVETYQEKMFNEEEKKIIKNN